MRENFWLKITRSIGIMRKRKSDLQHKKDYWVLNAFNPQEARMIIKRFPQKPATMGEAAYLLHQRWLDLLSQLPIIGKYIK